MRAMMLGRMTIGPIKLSHPFMQDWIASAQEEDWVIERFEPPASA